MNDTLVLFVTDGGYLAPSVLAAEQVLAQGIGQIADVAIYTIDVAASLGQRLQDAVDDPAFRVVAMAGRDFEPPAGVGFPANHVPVATLARLSIEPEIPRRYRRLVYLDGDIQVVGDITPLITHHVAEGKLMAGRGSAWLDPADEHGLEPPGYLAAVGVTKEQYVNAGVLACERDTWAVQAPRALRLFFENSSIFTRHDQSALNAAFAGDVEYLHPAFNFHSPYAAAYAHRMFEPRIVHFTGRNKPWRTNRRPWGRRYLPSYHDLLRRHPDLASAFPVADAAPGVRGWPGDGEAWLRESVRLTRERDIVRARRRLIRDYVDHTTFAFAT